MGLFAGFRPISSNPKGLPFAGKAWFSSPPARDLPMRPRFHLAFPVRDLAEARAFYGDVLGCQEGRSADEWVDFDFFGHQIVAHLSHEIGKTQDKNLVDGDDIPVRHFGVILAMPEWRKLAVRLQQNDTKFLIEPHIRFAGTPGEQATLFITDPSGNALEFKAFEDDAMVFAR
jgi:extradiol dioxygenase family protein